MSGTPSIVEDTAPPTEMSGTPSIVEDTPKANTAFNLETILSNNHEAVEHPGTFSNRASAVGWDEEGAETQAAEGYCVECEG